MLVVLLLAFRLMAFSLLAFRARRTYKINDRKLQKIG